MSDTMGGSDISCCQGPDPDVSEPDSDVPDELRVILASHSERNSVTESFSFRDDQDDTVSKSLSPNPPADPLPTLILPSSALPALQLPVFHGSLIDDEQNQFDIGCMNTSHVDTKRKNTFDFTGELKKLQVNPSFYFGSETKTSLGSCQSHCIRC